MSFFFRRLLATFPPGQECLVEGSVSQGSSSECGGPGVRCRALLDRSGEGLLHSGSGMSLTRRWAVAWFVRSPADGLTTSSKGVKPSESWWMDLWGGKEKKDSPVRHGPGLVSKEMGSSGDYPRLSTCCFSPGSELPSGFGLGSTQFTNWSSQKTDELWRLTF